MVEQYKLGDRVAVLVDCDNTSPEILEYALRVVAQFGRDPTRVWRTGRCSGVVLGTDDGKNVGIRPPISCKFGES